MLNMDSLNVVSLTADHVDTGTLDANLVKIAAEDGSYSYTIDGTGIKANNGVLDTLKFDLATGLLTIISALIQSATGYPRVELNSSTTLISAYSDANNQVDIAPTYGGAPAVVFRAAGTPGVASLGTSAAITSLVSDVQLILQSTGNMNLTSNSGDIRLSPSGSLTINGSTGQTGTVYVSATSGGVADIPITFTKGIRTT